MSVLTRNEETIMIALCRLGGDAHGPALAGIADHPKHTSENVRDPQAHDDGEKGG